MFEFLYNIFDVLYSMYVRLSMFICEEISKLNLFII